MFFKNEEEPEEETVRKQFETMQKTRKNLEWALRSGECGSLGRAFLENDLLETNQSLRNAIAEHFKKYKAMLDVVSHNTNLFSLAVYANDDKKGDAAPPPAPSPPPTAPAPPARPAPPPAPSPPPQAPAPPPTAPPPAPPPPAPPPPPTAPSPAPKRVDRHQQQQLPSKNSNTSNDIVEMDEDSSDFESENEMDESNENDESESLRIQEQRQEAFKNEGMAKLRSWKGPTRPKEHKYSTRWEPMFAHALTDNGYRNRLLDKIEKNVSEEEFYNAWMRKTVYVTKIVHLIQCFEDGLKIKKRFMDKAKINQRQSSSASSSKAFGQHLSKKRTKKVNGKASFPSQYRQNGAGSGYTTSGGSGSSESGSSESGSSSSKSAENNRSKETLDETSMIEQSKKFFGLI